MNDLAPRHQLDGLVSMKWHSFITITKTAVYLLTLEITY